MSNHFGTQFYSEHYWNVFSGGGTQLRPDIQPYIQLLFSATNGFRAEGWVSCYTAFTNGL